MAISTFNWLDLVSILILFFMIFQGVRAGFVHQLFGLLQIVISYIVAVSYFHVLAGFLNNVLNIGDLLDKFFDFPSALIEGIGHVLVSIISFLILFFLTRLAVKFIGGIIGVGTFLPVVGSLNKLLGGLFGFIKGLIIISIVMAVMYVLPWEFFQESLWGSQIFMIGMELYPQLLTMLENTLELNLPEILELEQVLDLQR